MLEASAWGKHLFAEFGGDAWLHVHLGLIGKMSVQQHRRRTAPGAPPQEVAVQGAVRLRLLNDTYVGDLRGPTQCAVVTPEEIEAVHARLGPDPLRPGADPEVAWRKIHRSRRPVAELLMDQAVVAGIGNVYRCELLFRHRVDPFRPGTEIRPATWAAIWQDVVDLMPLGRRVRPDHHDGGPGRDGQGAVRRDGVGAPDGAPLPRLQAHRAAVPGVRLDRAHPPRGRPQPVLVRPLPAPPVTGPRTAHRAGPAPGLPVARWAR